MFRRAEQRFDPIYRVTRVAIGARSLKGTGELLKELQRPKE
jgi:hypothetical protein